MILSSCAVYKTRESLVVLVLVTFGSDYRTTDNGNRNNIKDTRNKFTTNYF